MPTLKTNMSHLGSQYFSSKLIYNKIWIAATVLSGVALARSFPFVVQKLFIFLDFLSTRNDLITEWAGPRSAVGNVSGYRCVSDCRSRGREFDPGPVPYFRGD